MSSDNSPEKKIPKLTFKAFDELRELKTLNVSRFQRNKHPKDQIEQLAKNMEALGTNQAIHIDTKYDEVMFGHGRWEAALLNGYTHYPVIYHTYESDEVLYASVQADNGLAQWSELDLSAINNDLATIGPFDINLLGIQNFSLDTPLTEEGVSEDRYTKKITIPVYEPKGEKPSVSELFTADKTSELIDEISSAEIDDDVRQFLVVAAQRHTVFDYEKIAEYYCHQPKRVQDLMEKSALVLIDFDKAIENGFVKMTKDIAGAYDVDED